MVEVNVKTGEQLMKVGRIADAVHKKFDIQLLDGYGEAGYNSNFGNTYIWNKDYPVSFYLPERGIQEVMVLFSHPYDGEETTRKLRRFKNLDALYKWVDELNDDRG